MKGYPFYLAKVEKSSVEFVSILVVKRVGVSRNRLGIENTMMQFLLKFVHNEFFVKRFVVILKWVTTIFRVEIIVFCEDVCCYIKIVN